MSEQKSREALLAILQEQLGHFFSRPQLLEEALTHSSYAHASKLHKNNERLEFLGDAVLELCVSEGLFMAFPEASEGQMTVMRASLVNGHVLSGIAEHFGITDLVLKSIGDEWQGQKQKESLGADALEALIAAVFIDAGLDAAKGLVHRLLLDLWPKSLQSPANEDYKSRLQEWTMRVFHALPTYSTISETGPEHAKTFMVMAKLPSGEEFVGTGPNRRKAEQAAASKALENKKKRKGNADA